MRRMFILLGLGIWGVFSVFTFNQANAQIVHDAEYYILKSQNGEKWAAEDKALDQKLADLRKKNGGKPPNIVYLLKSASF